MSALREFLKTRLPEPAKEALKRQLRAYASATASWRILPDFLIIGAQKCGTSSLFYYIQQHPHVGFAPAITKEVHYFDEHFDRGERWYRSHFPLGAFRSLRRAAQGEFITGEASPEYLYHPDPPARIQSALPDARIIAVLRHPTDRAFSHYQMQRKRNREQRSFEEAVTTELERLEAERRSGGYRPVRANWDDLENAYLRRGLYLDQLASWRDAYPAERLLILRSEDLFATPQRVYERTIEFLGLKPWAPAQFENIAPGGYDPIDPALRRRLDEFFEPENARLAEAFGEEFRWTDQRRVAA